MKSRHTWQRFSLGWKVSDELRVNWKASRFSAFGFKRETDASQFEGIPCSVMWKQQFGFLCFPSRLCERQCCPVSARGSVVPSLREAVSLLASSRGSVCLASARGIVVSLYLAFSMHARFLPFFRPLGWLMHASHMLSYRICSGPLTMLWLHDSGNQNSMFRRPP